MSVCLFIVGEPGVGKTTLARRFVEPDSYLVQTPKWTVGERVCAAGHYTGSTFDGADTVPYGGVKAALDFYEKELTSKPLTVFDGDRFSYQAVIDRLVAMEEVERVACVLLKLSERAAQERRDARGSKQNAAWVKGRKTKAERFAGMFDNKTACLPIHCGLTTTAESLESIIRGHFKI